MTPEEVRQLARAVPERWSEIELVHRSNHFGVRATIRHGERDGVRLEDGQPIEERGATPSSWTVRPLEPYATDYQWTAQASDLPDGVDLALDLQVGIVVSSRNRRGRPEGWFTNQVLRAS